MPNTANGKWKYDINRNAYFVDNQYVMLFLLKKIEKLSRSGLIIKKGNS
jgi:hypothetical protein